MRQKLMKRHTSEGLSQPQSISPKLCRIVFSVDDREYQIQIFPHSQIKQLARQLSQFLSLDCASFLQDQICSKIKDLYNNSEQDQEWKSKILQVLDRHSRGSSHRETDSHQSSKNGIEQNSFIEWRTLVEQNRGKKRWYFETNQINCQEIQQQQEETLQNRSSDQEQRCPVTMNLYEKAMYNKVLKQQKANNYKLQKQREKMSQCTFHPRIHSKTPSHKDQIFDRLYQNAFQLKKKKQQRFNTLQSEMQQENSKLSFLPEINECSRQIIRLRNQSMQQSYSPHKSHCQSYNLLPKQNLGSKLSNTKNSSNKKQDSKRNNFSFHPQLSTNTQKITENLPKFEQRLLKYNQKSKKRHSPHKLLQKTNLNPSYSSSMTNIGNQYRKSTKGVLNNSNSKQAEPKQTERFKRDLSRNGMYFIEQTSKKAIQMRQILKPKKQLYRLQENLFSQQQENEMQSKVKERTMLQDVSNTLHGQISSIQKLSKADKPSRSQELYNTRKSAIFQRIYEYLVDKKVKTVSQFSQIVNRNTSNLQIQAETIRKHPYLPQVIKDMFEPMASQMSQLNISLQKQEFTWSLQKIYQSLTIGDKGVLLGWGVKLLPQGSSFV